MGTLNVTLQDELWAHVAGSVASVRAAVPPGAVNVKTAARAAAGTGAANVAFSVAPPLNWTAVTGAADAPDDGVATGGIAPVPPPPHPHIIKTLPTATNTAESFTAGTP